MRWTTVATIAVLVGALGAASARGMEPACGDGTLDGQITAADALQTLRTGTGSSGCDSCLCDTNGDGTITAGDALCVLRLALELACTHNCTDCGASVCGDDTVPPVPALPIGTSIHIDDCLLLAVAGDFSDDITVTVIKALDADLVAVDGVEPSVRNRGCDCGFFVAQSDGTQAAEPSAASMSSLRSMRASASSTTSSTYAGDCNCYVGVYVDAPEPLAVVEVVVDVHDGDCDELGFDFPVVTRVDAGVEEECDDGNALAGDGCSEICLLEPEIFCESHEDCAADHYCSVRNDFGLCLAGCRDGESCPPGQVCALTGHVCVTAPPTTTTTTVDEATTSTSSSTSSTMCVPADDCFFDEDCGPGQICTGGCSHIHPCLLSCCKSAAEVTMGPGAR